MQCNLSGSVRAQRLARVQLEPTPRTCTRETRIARPPTSHRNWQLPEIFLPLASTMVFSVMDGPNNVMQLLSYYLYQISLPQVAVKGLTTPLLRWLQVLCLFV